MKEYKIVKIIIGNKMTFGYAVWGDDNVHLATGEYYPQNGADIQTVATLCTDNIEEVKATCWDYINAADRDE